MKAHINYKNDELQHSNQFLAMPSILAFHFTICFQKVPLSNRVMSDHIASCQKQKEE
jgi:hypothetical protein